jgi:putative transposase
LIPSGSPSEHAAALCLRLRADRTPPSRSNEVWALDFVHDQLAMGTKLRILTVIDTFSRYAPVVDPRLAYRGVDVVATPERACKEMDS